MKQMRNRSVEKKLEFYMDTFKTVVYLLIATGGGTVGLMLKTDNPVAPVFALAGSILEGVWAYWAFSAYFKAKKLLKELEK
jgi:hypothetical protein